MVELVKSGPRNWASQGRLSEYEILKTREQSVLASPTERVSLTFLFFIFFLQNLVPIFFIGWACKR